ncbi:MAG: YceD family protein [Gammaproteobacteria bacterium]|nr:YceD family protein [Gammaproteobacteria bacterium]
MLMELPASFDPYRAATANEVIKNQFDSQGLERLKQSVLSIGDEPLQVELEFSTDITGRSYLKGKVALLVELECQRCLQGKPYPLTAYLDLVLLRHEGQVEKYEGESEPVVIEDDGLDLKTLIEDELILALPIIAMHDEDCQPWQAEAEPEISKAEAEPERENPFAMLAQLKKD